MSDTENDDGLGIPDFLRVENRKQKSESEMKPTKTMATEEATAADAPAKQPKAKANGAVKANGHAKPEAKAKAAKPAAKAAPAKAVKAAPVKPVKAKAAPAKAAKAKARKPRERDPDKLDDFGFRLGSTKSKAAAMYGTKKGATLAEVKAELGSVQYNLLTELEAKGFKIDRVVLDNDGKRKLTRYKIQPK